MAVDMACVIHSANPWGSPVDVLCSSCSETRTVEGDEDVLVPGRTMCAAPWRVQSASASMKLRQLSAFESLTDGPDLLVVLITDNEGSLSP